MPPNLTVKAAPGQDEQVVQAIVHLQHQLYLFGPRPTLAPSEEREREAAELTMAAIRVILPGVTVEIADEPPSLAGNQGDESRPKKGVLRFESAPRKEDCYPEQFDVWPLFDEDRRRENANEIREALCRKEVVELDFSEVKETAGQPELHALLFEAVRVAWALRVPIYVVGVNPELRTLMEFVESYSLKG